MEGFQNPLKPMFNPKSKQSILSYAARLEGLPLHDSFVREGLSLSRADGSGWSLRSRNAGEGSKGGFGAAVQEGYFGLELDSRPEPDFAEAQLELKTTALRKLRSGKWVPKERLKITAIDYHALHSEAYEDSRLAYKANDMLIIFYLHEPGVDNPLKLRVDRVLNWGLGSAPKEVLQVIQQDYLTLQNKVAAGLAHEISGGDTQYLEALTSGTGHGQVKTQPCSPEPAKPRSFALKQSLLREILRGPSVRIPAVINPVKQAVEAIKCFKSRTAESLRQELGPTLSPTGKGLTASITRRILGKDLKRSLDLGEIKVVNMRCREDWTPNESVPFPAFVFQEIVQEEDWYSSSCRQQMEQGMLLVVWRRGTSLGDSVLLGAFPWTLPQSDLEGPVHICWERTRQAISDCDGSKFPGASERLVAHVRPHAKNKFDTDFFPDGTTFTKQSFWLNQCYLQGIVTEAMISIDSGA
jgi:DNA mismatch repair protein MutH